MTTDPAPNAAPNAAPNTAPAAAPNAAPNAAPALTAPWSASNDVYKVGEGANAKEWWNVITEAPVRELMATKAYKNPNELAMAYHNLNKLQNNSGDVVALPKADAPPEAWNAFYSKMGRPEHADKYDLKAPEGQQMDPNMLKFGKEMFFEMGLSPQKAQAMTDKWNKFIVEQQAGLLQQDTVKNNAEVAALTTKWGADGEKYKAAGVRAMHALGLDAATVTQIEGKIGSAAILNLLTTLGQKMGEGGKFIAGGGTTDPNNVEGMTKEQATARITQLKGDAAFQAKLTDKKHPEQKEALALWEKLFAKAG